MKRVGIVCEFNPFHNGHRYLLDAVRARGAEEIVCVMSEYFVQRCEPCVLPAQKRAETAVLCGADAVFSLPFPWSTASAEYFAGAGMYLLKMLGCDAVAFGSECCDLAFLQAEAAKSVRSAEKTESTAAVYDRLPSNDILGTAYLRACSRLDWHPEVLPVKRKGVFHNGNLLPDARDEKWKPGGASNAVSVSSTAARAALRMGKIPTGVPRISRNTLMGARTAGLCPSDMQCFEDILFSFWRTAEAGTQNKFAECGGGVAERLCNAARKATFEGEMFLNAATKKYTDARLRRAALFGYLRVKEDLLHENPAYTRLLACGEAGKTMLKKLPEQSGFSVVSNVRNLPKTPAAEAQKAAELRAEALLTLLFPIPLPAGSLFRLSPVMLP